MKKVNNNLEPASQVWARTVENAINNLEATFAVLTEANRVSEISLRTVTSSVLALQEQQALLTSQQSILAEQQATLTRVVNSIPITSVVRGNRTDFAVPGPETTQLTITIPWIEGKTRCEVFAVASTEVMETESGNVLWRINIDDVPGDYVVGWKDGLGSLGGMAKASATISTGTDFNVVLRSAPTMPFARDVENSASLDVIAVFN